MKEEIERLIKKFEDSQVTTEHQIIKELKALIEPEKWEPKKELLEYGEEAFQKYFVMAERNKRIFLAKREIGAEDGGYCINFRSDAQWQAIMACPDNPEITFGTRKQAELVADMLQLNANPS